MYRKIITFLILSALILFAFNCGERYSAKQLWDMALQKQAEKKYEEALNYFDRLIKAYPEDSLASLAAFSIGDLYTNELKDYEKAIKSYEKVVEQYATTPEGPKAQFMIGFIYANTIKDYEKAKASYQKFLEIYPEHELKPSVEFELRNLGKDLEEIPELKEITTTQ